MGMAARGDEKKNLHGGSAANPSPRREGKERQMEHTCDQCRVTMEPVVVGGKHFLQHRADKKCARSGQRVENPSVKYLTFQEKFEEACGRLHKATDNLCRAVGAEIAPQPTDAEIAELVTAIDACTATADTLATPWQMRPAAKAPEAPAAKPQKRKVSR